MPVLVQFGAGCIGRGFIVPLFAAAGWDAVFVEVDGRLLRGLAGGTYRIHERDAVMDRNVTIGPVRCIDGRDREAVAAALAGADLAATAVGLAALPAVAPAIAAGLLCRTMPLDVLVCENGLDAHTRLRQAVLAAVPAHQRADAYARLGCVRTSIGRMIPPAQDGIDLVVEPYADLPVDAAGFRLPPPIVPHLLPETDFAPVIARKLYLHNGTHACLAYAGHLRRCTTIADCVAVPAIRNGARVVADEVCAAITRRFGIHAGHVAAHQAEDLFRRFANPHLHDPVARVARDPWRKLAADDRLTGAARFCLDAGVRPDAICRHIALALRYRPADDEPDAARWRRLQDDPAALLVVASGLPPDHPLVYAILRHCPCEVP